MSGASSDWHFWRGFGRAETKSLIEPGGAWDNQCQDCRKIPCDCDYCRKCKLKFMTEYDEEVCICNEMEE